jgi:hypothetical protein
VERLCDGGTVVKKKGHDDPGGEDWGWLLPDPRLQPY